MRPRLWPLLVLRVASISGCAFDPANCESGALDCACAPINRCNDGLACFNASCVPTEERSLVVEANDARSCELVVEDSEQAQVVDVRFLDGVRGQQRRQGGRTALALFSQDGQVLSGDALRLRSVGMAGSLVIKNARCFDPQGNPIIGTTILIR